MGLQVTLLHHRTTRRQNAWHLEKIIIYTKTHPIWYHTYQLTRIKTQVFQIILRQSHLTKTMIIINGEDVRKREKINAGLIRVLIIQSKCAQILQSSYLQPCSNQISLSSNWTRIHYSSGFISYPSWIHLKWYFQHFRNIHVTFGLSIHKKGRNTILC